MRSACLLLCLLVSGAVMAQEEPSADSSAPDPAPTSTLKNRFYVGGWLGGSFGDVVSRAEVAPELGFIVVPKFHLGGSIVYRYRKDKRFEPDLSTTQWGGSLYGRYFVYSPIFLQAGAEQISWEFPILDEFGNVDVVDADHTAVLIGPGFALPLGPKAASYMTFLYDINYDSDGPNPYDRPWMIRVGIGIGL
jgi:hypothetical protein